MSTTEEIVSPMVEMDAREFGLHLKEGGWRMGLLVARSVEPGEGQQERRDDRLDDLEKGRKVSASHFADMAETSYHRVLRYYRAWERYAGKGKVPHAADLNPGDEPELIWERLPHWSLSEAPPDTGATGSLNLTVRIGQYGQRLLRSHKRFLTFVEKELPEAKSKPGKQTRDLAGSYAACLEAEARLLRKIEAGEDIPSKDELREELNPSKFFQTA